MRDTDNRKLPCSLIIRSNYYPVTYYSWKNIKKEEQRKRERKREKKERDRDKEGKKITGHCLLNKHPYNLDFIESSMQRMHQENRNTRLRIDAFKSTGKDMGTGTHLEQFGIQILGQDLDLVGGPGRVALGNIYRNMTHKGYIMWLGVKKMLA